MRRQLLLIAIAVALVAAACGSSTTPAESSTTDPEATDRASQAARVTDRDDSVESESEGDRDSGDGATTTPEQAPLPAAPVSADDCGASTDQEPEIVDVAQIPGDGRQDTISALENADDDSFAPPLVDLNRIISGGPPPDGIPPVDEPVFQTVSSVDWLRCNEPVLALSVDGQARAYPVQIMTWHELVNDTFDDIPVTVSYCPLCNSALAYRRDLEDLTVTFGTSGRLFNSSLVMYDRETESLWTHFDGLAVAGELVGTELELLPIQTLSWQSFRDANPEGLVLTRDTGHDRRYGQNPYPGYDNVNTSPFLLDQSPNPRLAAKERIVGIRLDGDSVAVVLETLSRDRVITTSVGDTTVTVWHLPGTATALETAAIAEGRDVGATGAFLPVVEGELVEFGVAADGTFVDAATGSTWNISGLAVDGPLEGTQLEAVEHLDTFWFALAAFEPDTRIVD